MATDSSHAEGHRGSDYETGIKIRSLLDTFGIDYRVKKEGSFFYVRCPFHNSTSKSLWIHRGGRKIKCHRCNHESDFNDYAVKVGLPKLKSDGPGIDGRSYIKRRFQSMDNVNFADVEEFTIPRNTSPWKGPWRGLPESFMTRIGARRMRDRRGGRRAMFIITHENEMVGYTARTVEKDGDPKWLTSKDLPTDTMWFMLDRISKGPVLVITEGPFDALRLLRYGIPAVAVMGAETWSAAKTDSLLMRSGLRHIIVAGDGDHGGEALWDAAKSELEGQIDLIEFAAPAKKDPGDAPISWVKKLRAKCASFGAKPVKIKKLKVA